MRLASLGAQCDGWVHSDVASWGDFAPISSQPELIQLTDADETRTPDNTRDDFPFSSYFPYWQVGSGGHLSGVYDPPVSNWGMAAPNAGSQWNWLTSITYPTDSMKNASGLAKMAEADIDLSNPPIVQAFHGGHWGGWTFAVNGSSTSEGSDNNVTFSFSKGGYQEARGMGNGGESHSGPRLLALTKTRVRASTKPNLFQTEAQLGHRLEKILPGHN